MWLGVDYYPEQWDSSLLNEDLDNIVELGSNVIRIAEFSWHLMEKQEGQFDFSFFDNVIKKAKEKNLKVIMGTPTATIPAWLAKKHPSILSEFENGQKRVFGGRHVYCFNSDLMYHYSEKIIRALVSHYKDEEGIVAWQIDNEFGHEDSDSCYCNQCDVAFQKYLQIKFSDDIDRLNFTYGTTFWSQEYNEFNEIPTPKATITTHNPALRLDWERFRSESIVNFAKFQVELIKEIIPNSVVIHDFSGGGLQKHYDFSEVSKSIDVVAYNNYPVWGGQKVPILPHQIAFNLDYVRGLKGQNFWITEAIMGAQGHDITGFSPRPNQAKMWSYQGLAHGCSSMMYFRYRGATKGAEQFCYGVIDADNQKRRKFKEVQALFKDAISHEKALETEVDSQVAMIYDYDSLAAFRIQQQSILLSSDGEMEKLYKPFYDVNVSVDILPHWADISKYKILLVPLLIIGKDETRAKIKDFAQNGGTVVFTYRSSVKDSDNNLTLGEMLPVGYQDLVGAYVEEIESLQDENAFPIVGLDGNPNGYGGVFREMLCPTSAKVLYNYGDEFYQEFACVTKNTFGKGNVYYLGCTMDGDSLANLVNSMLVEQNISKIDSPEGVEVVLRNDNKTKIIINHNAEKVTFDGEQLAPFGCIIKE